ncbi:MAG: DUF1573 domain-containing protein, partial [Candidatus Zixiibacteriota bacterium]
MLKITKLHRSFALLFLALLTAASTVFAQPAKGPQPRIEIDHDYYYFGYMPFNAIVQHKYWIRNKGADTLQIIKVKPGCGCTAAPISKEHVAPGDSAELKVIFDSKNMIGKMVKEVEIFSNDPNRQAISVKFFALVNQEHQFIRAEPNT